MKFARLIENKPQSEMEACSFKDYILFFPGFFLSRAFTGTLATAAATLPAAASL
jgi:hypothetical protein